MMSDFFHRYADRIVILSESGCWIWMGATYASGYGSVNSGRLSKSGNRVPTGAHRAAFEAAFGPIPTGLYVCHSCDVRPCVNPNHLFAGTQRQNLEDMTAKGRAAVGGKHPMAKLDESDVRFIKRSRGKISQSDLAEKFGVSRQAIGAIHQGRIWKGVQFT